MSWLKKLLPSKISFTSDDRKSNIPEGLWHNCSKCNAIIYRKELEKNLFVCNKCDFHMYISARTRLQLFFNDNEFTELSKKLKTIDILGFKDKEKYRNRISQNQKKTNEYEALITGIGNIEDLKVVAMAFEFRFIGGSMGSVVGEKFIQGINYALAHNLPVICFSTSGGARMQEGLFSLMQMAKTSAAITKLSQAKLPFISVLINPVYGGVSASLAMLGDIIIAEPKASIGFAGKRVIEQTVKEKLPDEFQTSEFLLNKGFIDMIVDRRKMKQKIVSLLQKLTENK